MCRCGFDLPAKQAELGRLQKLAADPGLWDDRNRAQKLMQQVARLESLIATWTDLERRSSDLEGLFALADEAGELRLRLM